jgi:hypothetical protein
VRGERTEVNGPADETHDSTPAPSAS